MSNANSYGSNLLALLTRMQGSATPIDMAQGDDDARIPAALWREFVDKHAELLRTHSSGPQSKGVLVPFALWDLIEDFIQQQVDVVDGDYGESRPNRAMQLFASIEQEVHRCGVTADDGGITQALVAMARANAIEECDRVCDKIRADCNRQSDDDAAVGALMCLEGIRAIDAVSPSSTHSEGESNG